MRLSVFAAAIAVVVGACALSGPASAAKPKADKPIAKVLSCLRGSTAMVLAAARSSAPGIPENSLAAFDRVLPFAPVIDIDVSGSADGVLFLMRDATLDRTTTGSGKTAESYWADLETLRLKDSTGAVTGLSIPTLEQAVDWSQNRAILEINKQLGATWSEIIAAMRAKGAEDRVIAVVGSFVEVAEIRRMSEKVGVRFNMRAANDSKRLKELGVKTDGLIAWNGATAPDSKLWDSVRKKIALGFDASGSNGGENYDARFAADGDLREYGQLSKAGVDLLLTSAPETAAAVSKDAAKGRKSCVGR